MSEKYIVKQGDCISSIADRFGLFPDTIWNDPENRELKEKRKDPNILLPGDTVFVRDLEEREETCATGQKHIFRKKGVPEKLRVQFMSGDDPISNEKYILDIDGELRSGSTDSNGKLEENITPGVKKVKLWLGEDKTEYVISPGNLDPIDEVSGVQARLNNLGFNCGKPDGKKGPKTTIALRRFQKRYDLKETGEIDKQTVGKLESTHIS